MVDKESNLWLSYVDVEDEQYEEKSFPKELEELLNRYCKEGGSDTPDFILAQYLIDCLDAYNNAFINRKQWYKSPNIMISSAEIGKNISK